jgi:enoyl-CoA hydratase/carnithine racemase
MLPPGEAQMTSASSILVRHDGVVATVVLNRPDRLNALDLATWRLLGDEMRRLDGEDSLRAVVLRGAGSKAFASGADIAAFPMERSSVELARRYGEAMQRALDAVSGCRHPTVALIEGVCVGGGLEIAACCDLRICGRSSRFGVPINRLGLTMAYGELKALLDLVGPSASREILLEGRVFDAEHALRIGLVTRVVQDAEVEAEAYTAARRISDGAPLVARWHKKFIRRLGDRRPLSDEEFDESYAAVGTEDYQEGIRAFLEKRRPQFSGR